MFRTEILKFRQREVQIRRKPYRRSIGLTLQANGRIRISAPCTLPLFHIERFLIQHTEWIETQLVKFEALRKAYPTKKYIEGEVFPYLGHDLRLRFVRSRSNRSRVLVQVDLEGGTLLVEIPSAQWEDFSLNEPHPELANSITKFYNTQARALLAARLDHYSEKMNLMPSAIAYRSQKTRWGSCTVGGKISLNSKLIFAPLRVIDYVVVHELSHLRHYNHSDSFWALVESHIPDYVELRQWLKDHQYEADFLAKRSEIHPS